ncbi:hypothetical protein CSV63_04815 [Sporosarcina sp. P34]|uniref:ABC transporter substrate-binding protein n=1 Tax=Sporosarcina sp. P34 TaxID=2048247 RepID=UPI000C165A36|nr:ABC transporter substrate-binding protein [Sporosarcina sp. P34]PID15973.1 hypothetical protein CSV63_04815 [Sporosarcina sp. P34]
MNKKYWIWLSIILILAILSACGQSDNKIENGSSNDQINEADNAETYEPVTLDNFGREVTFTEPPKRTVGLMQDNAELMLALGLDEYLVGYSFPRDKAAPGLEEKVKNVPLLSKMYPSKEVLLSVEPDFVMGSDDFFVDGIVGTTAELEKRGVKSYIPEAAGKPATLENMVYKEIHEVSRIFGVKSRGDELIQSINETVQSVQEKISDEEPVRVFYMGGGDSGSAITTGGDMIRSHVVGLAGGENIFSELTGWMPEVSWEEVIERDPEVIVLAYCCGTTPEQLMGTISNTPSLQDVTAVKNKRYVTIEHADAEQSVRIPSGLETLAKGFYPDLFE